MGYSVHHDQPGHGTGQPPDQPLYAPIRLCNACVPPELPVQSLCDGVLCWRLTPTRISLPPSNAESLVYLVVFSPVIERRSLYRATHYAEGHSHTWSALGSLESMSVLAGWG